MTPLAVVVQCAQSVLGVCRTFFGSLFRPESGFFIVLCDASAVVISDCQGELCADVAVFGLNGQLADGLAGTGWWENGLCRKRVGHADADNGRQNDGRKPFFEHATLR